MLYSSFWTWLLHSYRASRNKFYCQNTKSKSGSKDERGCILLWGFSFLHFSFQPSFGRVFCAPRRYWHFFSLLENWARNGLCLFLDGWPLARPYKHGSQELGTLCLALGLTPLKAVCGLGHGFGTVITFGSVSCFWKQLSEHWLTPCVVIYRSLQSTSF